MRHRILGAAAIALITLAACRVDTRDETDAGQIDTIGDTTRRADPANSEITIGTENKRVVVPDIDVTDSSITLGKDTVTMKVPKVKTNP